MQQNKPVITTLSVEIKVLKIGRKQCTLSVFDQLPFLDKNFVESNYSALNIWGRVKRKSNWYCVGEKENELHVFLLPEKRETNWRDFFYQKYPSIDDRIEFLNLKKVELEIPSNSFTRRNDFVLSTCSILENKNICTNTVILDDIEAFLEIAVADESKTKMLEFSMEEEESKYEDWNKFVEQCGNSEQLFIGV